MLLDNKEAFKKWLIETLNPICEAEPDTLASYIVALVKKDRSEDELMELCCRELQVFLLDETKKFVKKLFETLRSKSYLPKIEEVLDKNRIKPVIKLTHYKGLPKRDQENIEEYSQKPQQQQPPPPREGRVRSSLSTRLGVPRHSPEHHRTQSRGSSRKAFEAAHNRKRSPPIRLGKRLQQQPQNSDDDVVSMASSRKRNRSDSSDRSAVSRTRYWRSRQHSRTPPTPATLQQKCPNYEKGYCKQGDTCEYQHGEDHITLENTPYVNNAFNTVPAYIPQQSLPNLTKPPPALPYNSQYPPIINPLPPSFKLPPPQQQQQIQYVPSPYQLPQQQQQQPPLQESFSQYQPEPYIPMPARFNQPPPLLATHNNNDLKQQQNNLVKVNTNDDNNNDNNTYNNDNNTYSNDNNTYNNDNNTYNNENNNTNNPTPNLYNNNTNNNIYTYNTTTTSNNNPNLYSNNPNFYTNNNNNIYTNIDDDEDDNASVTSRQSNKRTAAEVGLSNNYPDKQARRVIAVDGKGVVAGGSGKKNNSGSYQYIPNTVLEMRRIPPEDNTITNINQHFSKFGIIVNLQINFDNDACAALVAFASAAQASAAHKSKEPFLNNRFIRIFWHNPDKSTSAANAGGGGSGGSATVLDKQALQKLKTHVTIPQRHLLTLDNTKKKATTTTTTTTTTTEGGVVVGGVVGEEEAGKGVGKAVLVVPPRSALKLQRNPVKEGSRKIDKTSPRALNLRNKRQNLDKLLHYSKLIKTLFDNAAHHDERKQLSIKMESNMRSMKSLQEDIKRLTSTTKPQKTTIHPACNYKLNRKTVVKETKSTEGGPGETPAKEDDGTSASTERSDNSRNAFKKVNHKASALKTSAPKALLKVDRRPRELLVTGFPANEDKLRVLTHMKNFGEIEKSGYIDQPPSLLVTFKYRAAAEKALYLGGNYKEMSLKIIWWDSLINKQDNNTHNSNKNNNNNKDNNTKNNNNNNDGVDSNSNDKDNKEDNKDNSNNSKVDDGGKSLENNNKDNNNNNNINNNIQDESNKGNNNNNIDGVNKTNNNNSNNTASLNVNIINADVSSTSKPGDNNNIHNTNNININNINKLENSTLEQNTEKDKPNDTCNDADNNVVDNEDNDEEMENDDDYGGENEGGKMGDDDNDGGKEVGWMAGSNVNYFDDFHQNLDYEEDEVMDDKLLDEEEEEDEEDDGGRSWRR